jgi:hypothetical protein
MAASTGNPRIHDTTCYDITGELVCTTCRLAVSCVMNFRMISENHSLVHSSEYDVYKRVETCVLGSLSVCLPTLSISWPEAVMLATISTICDGHLQWTVIHLIVTGRPMTYPPADLLTVEYLHPSSIHLPTGTAEPLLLVLSGLSLMLPSKPSALLSRPLDCFFCGSVHFLDINFTCLHCKTAFTLTLRGPLA